MIAFVFDHLWQSTLFAAGAGLLTLTLRNNGAQIRFWLWFAASLKFLIPFAALTILSSYFLAPMAPQLSAPDLFVFQPAAQPFSAPKPLLLASVAPTAKLTVLLLALWGVGFAAIVGRWLADWFRLRRIMEGAVDLPIAAPVAVKSARSSLEPGLVGIWRPVILLPEGIAERLTSAEMDAVIAHELCHLRHRDNLLATIHMLVEASFWFYPPVWWLGGRLNTERERACDESVLASGRAPQVYAESILKVCKLYLRSPQACAAGVSGSDLKKRIEMIIVNKFSLRLSKSKKILLGALAVAIIAAPLGIGLVTSPQAQAKAQAQPAFSVTEFAKRRAEQALPRKAVPFDPKHFDNYVGYYQTSPYTVFIVTRDGEHFFSRATGQVSVELFPESETKFFATALPGQISFNTDSHGRVTELVMHQNGMELHAPRVSESAGKRIEASLAERIKYNSPSPGTEAALRHQIESYKKGQPDYSILMPAFAAATKEQWPILQQIFSSLGALKFISFKAVSPGGKDIYDVTFEHGQTEWRVAPPSPDGKIESMMFRQLP